MRRLVGAEVLIALESIILNCTVEIRILVGYDVSPEVALVSVGEASPSSIWRPILSRVPVVVDLEKGILLEYRYICLRSHSCLRCLVVVYRCRSLIRLWIGMGYSRMTRGGCRKGSGMSSVPLVLLIPVW